MILNRKEKHFFMSKKRNMFLQIYPNNRFSHAQNRAKNTNTEILRACLWGDLAPPLPSCALLQKAGPSFGKTRLPHIANTANIVSSPVLSEIDPASVRALSLFPKRALILRRGRPSCLSYRRVVRNTFVNETPKTNLRNT